LLYRGFLSLAFSQIVFRRFASQLASHRLCPLLPRLALPSKPPDQAESRGVLLLLEHARCLGQEELVVREVPAMLQAHLKTIDELIRCGERVLFEILRSAAEEAAVVLKVFESAGDRKLRREAIVQVSDAA